MTAPSRAHLAEQQRALVAALVAGGAPPAGFHPQRFAAARAALLNKRAREVSRLWPALAAALGPRWRSRFTAWADGRPPRGPLCDGFDFARELAVTGGLPDEAAGELAAREGYWRYDGVHPPEPRRLPAFARSWWGAVRLRILTRRRRPVNDHQPVATGTSTRLPYSVHDPS